MVEMTSIP